MSESIERALKAAIKFAEAYMRDEAGIGSQAATVSIECRAALVELRTPQFPKYPAHRIRDDMGLGHLELTFDSDYDVCMAIVPNGEPPAYLEFCTSAGGGKSPEVRAALVGLMCAMERDSARHPPEAL